MSMAGTWITNLVIAVIGACVVCIMSFSNNVLLTTLFRSGVAFVIFFLLGYIFRLMFRFVQGEKIIEEEEQTMTRKVIFEDGKPQANGQKHAAPTEQNPEEKAQLLGKLVDDLSDNDVEKVAKYVKTVMNEDR